METLTRFAFIRNSPLGQNSSHTERLGERIEECLWTNYGHVRARMHILRKPQTCMQTCPPLAHEYPSSFKVVCLRVFVRQQEMTGVRVSRPKRKKKRESLLFDEHTARQNMKTFLMRVQTEVEFPRPCWRHP